MSATPSDFVGQATCLASDISETTCQHVGTPPAGTALLFLVRVQNDCPAYETDVPPARACP